MEQFVPQLFPEAELPEGAEAVEVQLGVKLDGDGGGEWIVRLAAGSFTVETPLLVFGFDAPALQGSLSGTQMQMPISGYPHSRCMNLLPRLPHSELSFSRRS